MDSLFVFVFGAVIGSFLNALSFRFNTGRSVLVGRSRCMYCAHELEVLDLVPVLSYLFLRGKCRYCGAKISFQYPLVEVAAALLSWAVYLESPGWAAYTFWFLVWMVLLFIVIYDTRHGIIPRSAAVLLGILAFGSLFVSLGNTISFGLPALWAFAAGPVLALPLYTLALVSHGKWMGWGDWGLELSLGWLLGLGQGLTALMCAVWSGAAVGVILVLISKQLASSKTSSRSGYTMRSEIPFAPFLVLGALLAFFLHVDFFSSFAVLF